MEGLAVYIWPVLIGAVYFGIISLLKKYTRFGYKFGFFLALALILIFLAIFWVIASQDPSGWIGLAMIIMSIVMSVILATYLLGWFVVSLVSKKA
ncbi:MAG: hypothetical protein CVU85_08335 [Firmicutes bacterium HGW-Firmicutes-10]|nr:hypothetical protein [Erysipelotrichaceae bacterium]PKM86272.1 MAG: hypothetical protein CVU85_08335 [Firmicutes bacterium HGW-Firmicutes-10]